MYEIHTTSISGFLSSLWELVKGAWMLDPQAFQTVGSNSHATPLMLTLLFLAGLSLELGQSVMLLANRVSPSRFLTSLLLSGLLLIAGTMVWVTTFWLVGTFLFGAHISFLGSVRLVSLAFAPFLLGLFILLPYLGSFLSHVLPLWSFLAMIVAMVTVLHISLWQAFLSGLVGWLVIETVNCTLNKLIKVLHKSSVQIPPDMSLPEASNETKARPG